MKLTLISVILFFGIVYFTSSGFGLFNNIQSGNTALLMQGTTQRELDSMIIDYYKTTVVTTNTEIELSPQMIKKTVVDINDDGRKDVIATLESRQTCGSGGCIASIFVTDDIGELVAIPFSYAVKEIKVLDSITQGMHDLRINNDQTSRMIWNGTTYVLEQI